MRYETRKQCSSWVLAFEVVMKNFFSKRFKPFVITLAQYFISIFPFDHYLTNTAYDILDVSCRETTPNAGALKHNHTTPPTTKNSQLFDTLFLFFF